MKKLLSGMLLFAAASAWAADSDELWQMTIRTEMPGMPMPAMTQTVCLAKGAGYKPGKVPHQKRCEVTGLEVSGNKTSWNVNCSGRDPMRGNGEVTRIENTMKGTMKLHSSDMQMTQVISGKRIGNCQAK
ncbi:MAG: DUF3617 domain-containing protein [Pseudomonadota bacterium]